MIQDLSIWTLIHHIYVECLLFQPPVVETVAIQPGTPDVQ